MSGSTGRRRVAANPDKPVYRVPSMPEIAEIPWNGLKAISTFSGCGGSSLGYKLAGFRMLWANEFVPEAQRTYRLNHPSTTLDTQDIRDVDAGDILATIGLAPGELDLLDGSPPCSSFSTAGARQRNWGKEKVYSVGRNGQKSISQRTDDLFFEYIRLIDGLQPKVFVAENVSGLVKGVAKGYFLEILSAFRSIKPGYRVRAQLLEAQWLGVPQRRVRLFFIGVRDDLGVDPAFPRPLSYRYSVREAWDGQMRLGPVEPETSLEPYRAGNGRFWFELRPGETHPVRFNAARMPLDEPGFTLTATMGIPGAANPWHPVEFRALSLAETRRIAGFPDDFAFTGGYSAGMERMGRAVPPPLMRSVATTLRDDVFARLRAPALAG